MWTLLYVMIWYWDVMRCIWDQWEPGCCYSFPQLTHLCSQSQLSGQNLHTPNLRRLPQCQPIHISGPLSLGTGRTRPPTPQKAPARHADPPLRGAAFHSLPSQPLFRDNWVSQNEEKQQTNSPHTDTACLTTHKHGGFPKMYSTDSWGMVESQSVKNTHALLFSLCSIFIISCHKTAQRVLNGISLTNGRNTQRGICVASCETSINTMHWLATEGVSFSLSHF